MPGATRSFTRTVGLGMSATAACVLPLFLTGALAVQLRDELAFSAAGLGLAIAAYRGTSAVTAAPLGRLTDRLGARRTLRLAAALAALASLGIATTATAWWVLVAWLMVGGCANSLVHPAAHRLLIVGIQPERQGLAFGLKQTAQPTASMLAGLSVPLIAVLFGWRWAFVVGAALALIVVVTVPTAPASAAHRHGRDRRGTRRLRDRPTIVVLAIAFGLGNAAASSVPAFYVDSTVRAGTSPELAGAGLAAASIGALAVRLASGFLCDRIDRGHLRLCAVLLAAGAGGLWLLAIGRPVTMTIGVVVSLAAGWGYNVLLWYPLVRAYADAPGAITGALAPGGLIGGTVGPVLFGVTVDRVGDPAAWGLVACFAATSALAMLFGARRFERSTVSATGRGDRSMP